MEDGFQDPSWLLQVPGHTFWIDQRLGHVSGLYQQDPGREVQCFCDSIP